jgi:hypothetical protein
VLKLGTLLGLVLGTALRLGLALGFVLGEALKLGIPLGPVLGELLKLGASLGLVLGTALPPPPLFFLVGMDVLGVVVGLVDRFAKGFWDGTEVGESDGLDVSGVLVGVDDGESVGSRDGASDGDLVLHLRLHSAGQKKWTISFVVGSFLLHRFPGLFETHSAQSLLPMLR